MAFTRKQSREKQKYTYVKSEYVPSEADSTVAHWGPAASQAPRRKARRTESCNQQEIDWQNLPDGPLLRIFELLFADKAAAEDLHNAAATCTQWREAFLEVTLGDTAASRPERPSLAKDGAVKKEAPATTATACAAVCEPSKSETNGFEACSNRRQAAVCDTDPAAAAPSAPLGAGTLAPEQGRRLSALGPLAAALEEDALAAAAADTKVTNPGVLGPLVGAGHQRHQQRHRGRGRAAQHADLADVSPSEQLQQREHAQAAAAAGPQDAVAYYPAVRRRLTTAGAAANRAGRRSASLTGSEHQVASPAAAAAAAAAVEVYGPLATAAHRGRTRAVAGRPTATQQQEELDDEIMQPVAARGRTRRHAAAPANDASEDGGTLTDEVVQPTTAEGGDVQAQTGRRRRHRPSARTSSAAAAANATEPGALAVTGVHGQSAGHMPAAPTYPRQRRRRQQHHEEHPQQQQEEQQEQAAAGDLPGAQQQPLQADSTEAVAQGEPVGGGGAAGAAANGSQSRQNSGSNRPTVESYWFGGLFHLPSWFRRGGST